MTPVARVDSNAVAQRPAHLVTVRPGQHHVEDDRVERSLPRQPDAVSAVVHDIDGETFGLEPLPKPGGEALLREPAAPAPIPRARKARPSQDVRQPLTRLSRMPLLRLPIRFRDS